MDADCHETPGYPPPLGDVAGLGVPVSGRERIPAQTPLFESIGVPDLYFAGTATRGAPGLKKHGLPSSSGAVHGHRYNARILARHLAQKYFGTDPARPRLERGDVLPYLLGDATHAPELRHQKSYPPRPVLMGPAPRLLHHCI